MIEAQADVDEWLEGATPDHREVGVCLDRALISRQVEIEEKLADLAQVKGATLAEGGDRKQTEAALQAELDQLLAEIKSKTRTLIFRGIGWGPWRDLQAKHSPDPAQAETFEKAVQFAWMPHALRTLTFNASTFWPAAMAASCDELTPAQARKLIELLPVGVVDRITNALLAVNMGGDADPFAQGVGSEPPPRTEKK